MISKFIVGVDLGATNLKIGLLDSKYRIRYKKVFHTPDLYRQSALLSTITSCVKQILIARKLKKRHILGLGIGVPGPVDYEKGRVHFFPNIPGWKNVNLKAILEKKLRLPVFVDNDANLMSLAEQRLGAAKGVSNAVCLTLGSGVGAGLIVNKNLYRGSTFVAGEIGHVPINEKGPRCNCGGRACLESYVGNRVILKKARNVFKRDVTLEELSTLAKNGNKKAMSIWLDFSRKLGIALSGVINVLNPEAIVIGGGIANAGEFVFRHLRDTIKRRAMPNQARAVKIFKAGLGNNAGIIGAAILLKESLKS